MIKFFAWLKPQTCETLLQTEEHTSSFCSSASSPSGTRRVGWTGLRASSVLLRSTQACSAADFHVWAARPVPLGQINRKTQRKADGGERE